MLAPPVGPVAAGEEPGLAPPPVGELGAAVGFDAAGREVVGFEA